jgi:phosphotransferase system HPr-like phosphotransfer protein
MLEAIQAIDTQCKDAVQLFIQGGDQRELIEALKEVVAKLNQRPDLQ